jgi:2-C-methyl-D-erythritol 2,4-cyclodiphosphate synthase
MAIRFDAGARRAILAATIEAEKHGRGRPVPTDLLVGLLSTPDPLVTAALAALGVDAAAVLATAAGAGTEGGSRYRPQAPDDAERILQRAADIASARVSAEVGSLDILTAALHGDGTVAGEILTTSGVTPEALRGDRPPDAPPPRPSGAWTEERARGGQTRAGIGYDSHRFGDTGPLVLGGIRIPDSVRLVGHSDGDAIAHAITDAILGAAGAGDIGEMFSDTDPANKQRDSMEMLRLAVMRVRSVGLVVHQVDVTVVAERPRIAPHREAMRSVLARALSVTPEQVSVKGTTNEGMGWIGRGEGIACIAIATLIESSAV